MIFDYRLNVGAAKTRPRRFMLFASDTCNEQLLAMWRRRLPIIRSRLAGFAFNADLQRMLAKPYIGYLPFLVTEFEETNFAPPLEFSADDERRGAELKHRMGMADDDWFVCIHARDDVYHSQIQTPDGKPRPVSDKSHRNADIGTYMEAADRIGQAGGYVLRAGWGVERPLDVDNQRIVDYAMHRRSDFGDIFVSGKCRFFVASGAG
jgi:hypothetical protein